MGMGASLVNLVNRDYFNNLSLPYPKETTRNLSNIGPEASEEKSCKILNIFPIQMYGPIHMHRVANDLVVKKSNVNVRPSF